MDIRSQMENVIVDTMDRISQLPESIIHHILSYMDSLEDLVRMSILSTYWFGATASFPILIFNFFRFEKVIKSSGVPFGTNKDIRDTFFKYVEHTISRFREQNESVHTFNLTTPVLNFTEVDIINRCLELTIKKGLKVLVIDIVSYWVRVPDPCQRYQVRVPNTLLTATSLTSLTLSFCELPLCLMVDHVVKFKCLKTLCLKGVTLNEDVLKHLTTSCPLLEELIVKHCYGLKRFYVYGLLNLQQVEFCLRPEVERIDIDAPRLRFLCLNECGKTITPPSMNLASCKKLTKVCYHGKSLADLSSDFLSLKDLVLVLPDECNRLNVSSHSKCELDKTDVDSPNLQLFGCRDDLHLCSPKETNLVPSKACIEWDNTDDQFIEDHWFQKLRQFLDKKIWFEELKLHINVGGIVSIDPEVIQWPPIEFDHVELEAECFEYEEMYELVVDSLLWCCRPQSLTLIIDLSLLEYKEWETLVKHTYEKLLEQEDQAYTNIQFVMSSSSSKANMNFSDLSTLLKALPRDESKQKITFIKYRRCSRSWKRKPSKEARMEVYM